jgi:N-acetylmuramoyl-L-alanine amidase
MIIFIAAAFPAAAEGREPDFTIRPGFYISRPTQEITVRSENYYIMGVAYPEKNLLVNGEDIAYRAENGSFGAYVSLKPGRNYFEFSQPGESGIDIYINYIPPGEDPPRTAPEPVDEILQDSMYPLVSDVIKTGEIYYFYCTAPSGAEVSANLLDMRIELKQAEEAGYGLPARFEGKVVAPYDADEKLVKNMGKVRYTLDWEGETSEYESNGEIYTVGWMAQGEVRARDYMTNVYKSAEKSYDYFSVMDASSTDKITGQTADMFQLSSGGFVAKSAVEVVTGTYKPKSQVSLSFSSDFKGESINLKGAENAAYVVSYDQEAGVFSAEFFGVGNLAPVAAFLKNIEQSSGIFGSADITAISNGLRISLELREGQTVWGYGIDYSGGGTVLNIRPKPVLSSDPDSPLDGLIIMLDPGHGGKDPGALGPPGGENGPVEKDFNLDIARKAEAVLTKLGAEVYMTREDDTFVELMDRAALSEQVRPDLFISIHINSTAENSNGARSEGTEIHYFTPGSKSLASSLLTAICVSAGRLERSVQKTAFIVARPTVCPSVLCELGFINNPYQYEQMMREDDRWNAAQGIVNGVVDLLRE